MRCLPGGFASWDGNTDDLVVQSFANRPQPRNRCCQPGESPFETARRDPSIRFDVSAKVADPAYVDATSSQSRAGRQAARSSPTPLKKTTCLANQNDHAEPESRG